MNTLLTSTITVGTEVEVLNTDITARVTGILMSEAGLEYRIAYWHENQRRVDWVHLEEIQALPV